MTIDILFLAKNRLEFTRQSVFALIANTNWSLVRRLVVCDDGSTDGTEDFLFGFAGTSVLMDRCQAVMSNTALGSPAAAMNAFVRDPDPPDVFVKVDNDVILPKFWLDQCAAVMEAHPELDLLGIEPPASRVPSRDGMPQKPVPELLGQHDGYAPCDSIGGIGLMRTAAFLRHEPIRPHSTYGGFTEWNLAHPDVKKGWICPPLNLFLLDRLPMEPWASLSREYEAKGWQRPWGRYPMSAKGSLWNWWVPVEQEANASR